MTTLDTQLRAVRDSGRKALVPYFVAGLDDEWLDCVRAAAFAGADAIEIGVPFSDPIMDGIVIQEASLLALARGTTLTSVLEQLATLDIDVPLIVMTYFNIFHHHGLERAAADLAKQSDNIKSAASTLAAAANSLNGDGLTTLKNAVATLTTQVQALINKV